MRQDGAFAEAARRRTRDYLCFGSLYGANGRLVGIHDVLLLSSLVLASALHGKFIRASCSDPPDPGTDLRTEILLIKRRLSREIFAQKTLELST